MLDLQNLPRELESIAIARFQPISLKKLKSSCLPNRQSLWHQRPRWSAPLLTRIRQKPAEPACEMRVPHMAESVFSGMRKVDPFQAVP